MAHITVKCLLRLQKEYHGRIGEEDFKRWKYQAITRRDACAEGETTPEEYTQWLEAAFPNRKPKKE